MNGYHYSKSLIASKQTTNHLFCLSRWEAGKGIK